MVEKVKDVGGLNVRRGKVLFAEKIERGAKGVLGDNVAGARLEDKVELEHLARLAGLVHPIQQLVHVGVHDGLEATDARRGEEAGDGAAAEPMGVMVGGSGERVGG